MQFLGYSYLGNRYSLSPTVVNIPNITYVRVQNGIFDDVYVANDSKYDFTNKKWDFSTVLWAQFQNSLSAGNVTDALDDITSILVKRRKKGSVNWIPLFEIPVIDINSFYFERFDSYVANKTEYEYAIVLKIEQTEGTYNINSITPNFQGIFITSKERIFKTIIEAYVPTVNRVHPNSIVQTIDAKYPYYVSHSKNNFYTGDVSGVFVEMNDDLCLFDFDASYQYRHDLLDFLCDGKAKFLKLDDGRIWMICITGDPSESQEMGTDKFTTSFSFAEIGDVDSAIDLYDNGFIDVDAVRGK